MSANEATADAVFLAASDALSGSTKHYNNEITELFTPKALPLIKNENEREIQKVIERTADANIKEVLRNVLTATKLKQSIDDNTKSSEEVKIELNDKIVASVRALTRVASNQGLPATIILTRNSEVLTELACSDGSQQILNDTASVIRQAFRVTVSDYQYEEPLQGRTTKCYEIAVLLLRLYVNMHAYSLAEGIIQAIKQYSGSIPEIQGSPWKTQVQFYFYNGMFSFFKQKYAEAMQYFENAINCSVTLSEQQFERIMLFAIPTCYISRNRTPTSDTWEKFPRLRELYYNIITACRHGNFRDYRDHMMKHSEFLRRNRLYLVCDEMLVRLKLNLLRRTWEIMGRPKRLSISAYAKALDLSEFLPYKISHVDAAEFYISQLILAGEIKGYIHHDMQLVMLSKKQPFPNIVQSGTNE